jgi:AraC-like DNA-binding protein
VSEPTIGAGYPKALLMFAVSLGADRAALLDRAALASADLAEAEARVPLARYVALFEAAAQLTGDPALALRFGEAVRMQDISIVGLICEVAETTAEVGRQLNRFSRLVIDDGGGASDMVRAVPDREGLWMEVVSGPHGDHPFIIEAELARLVCNTRAMFGSAPAFQAMRFPLAAHFTHPAPPYIADYERIFAAPLVFGARRNALLLDPAFPFLRLPTTNSFAFGALSERAQALLHALEAAGTLRARVERQLMPILHTGDADMDAVARALGVGRRTLQRRLAAEGVTFEAVFDDLRRQLALSYLADRKVSANETAYLVGFSEPAAFSRAFKRWTGTTPGAWRPLSPPVSPPFGGDPPSPGGEGEGGALSSPLMGEVDRPA